MLDIAKKVSSSKKKNTIVNRYIEKKNNIKTDNDKEISERKKIKENNSIAFKNKENSSFIQ